MNADGRETALLPETLKESPSAACSLRQLGFSSVIRVCSG